MKFKAERRFRGLGWSWTNEIYGNHWEIDEAKFSSVKVSHKFFNNYILLVQNSFPPILSAYLSLVILLIF